MKKNEQHAGFLSSSIRADFLLLSHYIMLLKSKGLKLPVESYVVAFRKAVMGGLFETTEFKRQMEVPDARSNISNTRNEIKFRIEKCYTDWSANRSIIRKVGLWIGLR